MIEQKENDWVLNLLSNSNFSTADFKSVGLTAENTSLQSEETYKSSKQIQDLFQREDGTFDNEGFHKFYENAQLTYNMLANDTFMDDMYKQQAIYGKDNIFAPREQRRDFAQTVQHTRVPNPDRTVTGLIRVGDCIAYDTLDVKLPKGTHSCIATFTQVDTEKNKTCGQASAKIVITVNN